MIKFYKAKITKKPIGTAVEHIMPAFKGKVITNVYDITTDGDYRLFVVACNNKENKANLSLEGVAELSEENAISLAAKYQPARKVKRFNPDTKKVEELDIPVLNLKAYLA